MAVGLENQRRTRIDRFTARRLRRRRRQLHTTDQRSGEPATILHRRVLGSCFKWMSDHRRHVDMNNRTDVVHLVSALPRHGRTWPRPESSSRDVMSGPHPQSAIQQSHRDIDHSVATSTSAERKTRKAASVQIGDGFSRTLRCECRIVFVPTPLLTRSPFCRYSALCRFQFDEIFGLRHRRRDRRPSEAASSSISKLSVCRQIIDVAPHLLQQGVAVYLGPCGHRNTSVVAVYCKQSLWQRSPFSSEDLARLLLYYCSIQRRDEGGVVLVADAREAGPDAINTLLEALYTVEASCPGSLAVVHVVADRQARSLIFRSSVFQPQVRLKIDLLMGIEALFRIADLKRLPWELGGHSHHDHGAWIRQRAKLEAFLNRCRHSCSVLLSLIQELIMTFNDLPSNADQLHSLLDRRKQMAVQADLQLGPEERLLDEMLDAVQRPNATEDFREGVTVAEKLFQEVQDARDRLLRVSHNQQEHLHSCIQLQQLCAAAKESNHSVYEALNFC
ncbi:hypothetical protein CAPTEDRAFT_194087 [Capitella teleta]|uniref:CRAL-TRIO domain-containing protein n=1 Tax=Capitella teleta TaxID=283909 RepID=R7T895_CAPTE|nr:hypothetical protein CAPTEDRAFT_194087 [Capitella teleta]|eukprot:ELT89835.1 hypothetical protein CAPTEDRAFT_194087 [Capitella teleta]